jgi:predicted MPP superfamily phosphohydrolase
VLPLLLDIAAVAVACLAYASLVERNWFKLRTHRVPCLPSGARPLRVLHISDLHFRRRQRRKRAFLEGCARSQPDLVVCTGDFVDHRDGIDVAVETVSRLNPAVASLYVFGSHDYYASSPGNPFKYLLGPSKPKLDKATLLPWRDLAEKLAARGWIQLLNRTTTLRVDGVGEVDVVGLDDPHIRRDDLSVASERRGDGFRLGIVHSPDAAPALARLGYNLIVCGHTHGGQLRVPGFGALVTNTKNLPRTMARGLHRMDGSWLHVSAGLGTSSYAPVRFACRPEVCLLELVPRDA